MLKHRRHEVQKRRALFSHRPQTFARSGSLVLAALLVGLLQSVQAERAAAAVPGAVSPTPGRVDVFAIRIDRAAEHRWLR